MKKAAFTICAKNYLAQALTLKKSFERFNDIPFYIFLADLLNCDRPVLDGLVELQESWIPKWKEMAFKYDVVEFSTAIKPFCINKLFSDGFDKVVYLDPDIYVTDSLDYIYNILDEKSVMFTPHYVHLLDDYDGSVPDNALLGQGVFNLGFGAFKNSENGRTVIKWWMKKLQDKCFIDAAEGVFCDQKWMNQVPAYIPNDVEISHHMGINVAIWNLHERDLFIKDEKFFIRDKYSKKEYPLLFYHFSGFDPFVKGVINRRHPKFSTDVYPSFIPLIEEYRSLVYANGYDQYHSMTYAFITFSNGENIIPIQRRLFRTLIEEGSFFEDPFDCKGSLYLLLKKNKCLTKVFSSNITATASTKKEAGKLEQKFLIPMAKILKAFIGIRWYFYFVKYALKFSKLEYHKFLLKNR